MFNESVSFLMHDIIWSLKTNMSNNPIQLAPETIAAFKTLYSIDQSLRINHEDLDENDPTKTIIRTKSINKTTCCKIVVDQVFPRDLHIYDLSQFISVLSIVEDPVIDLSKDNYMTIKSADGKQKLRYFEANPEMVESYASRDPVLPNEDLQVVVTEAQFKRVLIAASTLKLDFIGFQGDGESVYITAFNKNEGGDEEETNHFRIEIGETDKNFNMFYKLGTQNVQIMSGKGDLMFTIDGSSKISQAETTNGEVFWFTFNASSEWED